MKQFIVIALSVGANSNRIFSAGDIVNEDAFDTGRAEELVKGGFLKEYEAPTVAPDLGDGDNVGDALNQLVGEVPGDIVNEDAPVGPPKENKPKKDHK